MSLAKLNLEQSRDECSHQIQCVANQIDETRQAINSKNAPRSVAEERTKNRAYNRPAPIELCQDAVQYRLHDEISDIEKIFLICILIKVKFLYFFKFGLLTIQCVNLKLNYLSSTLN